MGFPELRFEPEEDQKHEDVQEQAAKMSKKNDSVITTTVGEVSESSQVQKQVVSEVKSSLNAYSVFF